MLGEIRENLEPHDGKTRLEHGNITSVTTVGMCNIHMEYLPTDMRH